MIGVVCGGVEVEGSGVKERVKIWVDGEDGALTNQ